jgi:hypothetical protein
MHTALQKPLASKRRRLRNRSRVEGTGLRERWDSQRAWYVIKMLRLLRTLFKPQKGKRKGDKLLAPDA